MTVGASRQAAAPAAAAEVPRSARGPPDSRAGVTSKAVGLMLNSPNNPTGAVYTREETKAIVDFAVKHDLWILDDMIYSTLVWVDGGYTSPCAFEGGAERTITIGGLLLIQIFITHYASHRVRHRTGRLKSPAVTTSV